MQSPLNYSSSPNIFSQLNTTIPSTQCPKKVPKYTSKPSSIPKSLNCLPQTVPIFPSSTMASRSNMPCLETPKSSFTLSQQTEDWKAFYTKALDYLEALNINTDEPDETKTGWKQLKIMFEGKDWQTLQTLMDSETIPLNTGRSPSIVLDAIATTINSKDHFWHFCNKLLLDVHQRPDESIHALNTHITTLVNQCEFSDQNTEETLKIMVLQHAIW